MRMCVHVGGTSSIVSASATIWHGWLKSVSPLITGTLACSASSRMSLCAKSRAMMTSFMLESTLEMSFVASRLPMPISSPRQSAWPPSRKKPDSNETRVRVDGFTKIIESV